MHIQTPEETRQFMLTAIRAARHRPPDPRGPYVLFFHPADPHLTHFVPSAGRNLHIIVVAEIDKPWWKQEITNRRAPTCN